MITSNSGFSPEFPIFTSTKLKPLPDMKRSVMVLGFNHSKGFKGLVSEQNQNPYTARVLGAVKFRIEI